MLLKIFRFEILLSSCLLFQTFATGAERVASISAFKGSVSINRSATGKDENVRRRRTPLFQGDVVNTGSKSRASILFADGSRVDLNEKTSVSVTTKGREREIMITKGSLKSDIKKLPGNRTNFRTPAGVAAVKGTLVECVVKEEDKIEISADLGLLTFEIEEIEVTADLERGKRLEMRFLKDQESVEAKSLIGDVKLQSRNLATVLNKGVAVRSTLESVSDKISLEVTNGKATTQTDRGSNVVMDKGDAVDFVQTGTGTSMTVVSGQVTVIDESGIQTTVNEGETAVEMIGNWLEPETPEGFEVMIPPGT